MNKVIISVLLGLYSTVAIADPAPTVVELFTSQGCSSCPPADDNLAELAQRPDIVALGFHVTYWNNLGWLDPLSATWATARQYEYAASLGRSNVYTPQMMIDGTEDVVGSDTESLQRILGRSRQLAAARKLITLRKIGTRLEISIPLASRPLSPATIYIAAYDPARLTDVQAGENDGRKLRDANAVRIFQPIGKWDGSASVKTIDLSALGIAPAMGIAVFVQLGSSADMPGAIVAAGKLDPVPPT